MKKVKAWMILDNKNLLRKIPLAWENSQDAIPGYEMCIYSDKETANENKTKGQKVVPVEIIYKI